MTRSTATVFGKANRAVVAGCTMLVLLGASVFAGCGDDDEPAADAPRTVTVAPPPAATTPAERDGAGSASSGSVSRSRAIAIARKRAGGGRVDSVDRDDDDGRAVWKVKLARAGGIEREVSIRVSDGRVLKVETDRDDQNDRDDGDDDRDGD